MTTILAHSTISEKQRVNHKRITGIVRTNLLRKDSLTYLKLLVSKFTD